MAESQYLFEVAYATPHEQVIIAVPSDAEITVEEAILRSGILARFPDIDLAVNKVGIFGKATQLNTPLNDGDRVEIYRPLIADPKAARKKRAAQGKAMRKGARETEGAGTAE